MLPESQKGARCDFSVQSSPDEKKLNFRFVAKDLVALRAGFNTNLRLVSAALRTLDSAASTE
jgi:tRNA threonylcarbamoyladenosine modification (KEOPS) complex  Pcc1 subunit